MIRPFILDNNEEDFMLFKKQHSRIQEAILRIERGEFCFKYDIPDLLLQRDTLQKAMEDYDAKFNPGRKGHWMPLYSGTRIWPEDPRPKDIRLVDIAHSLARINRFNGHTRGEYSVAQHSVLVSRLIPKIYPRHPLLPKLTRFGGFHDSGESVYGDIITPIKRLFRELYEGFEEPYMEAAAETFDFLEVFNDESKKLIKRADIIMLATEVRDLTTTGVIYQPITELPMDERITCCWSPEFAEQQFLTEFGS